MLVRQLGRLRHAGLAQELVDLRLRRAPKLGQVLRRWLVGELRRSVSQRLGPFLTLTVKGKNLTNPDIETVYRSDDSGPDTVRSSYTQGIDVSAALTAQFSF